MNNLVVTIVACAIAVTGFIYAGFAMRKKKMALYFLLLVFAVGCFTLQQIAILVATLCNVSSALNIGRTGLLACNLFLVSANYGSLDSIVDDGSSENIPAKNKGKIAAAIFAIILAVYFGVALKTKVYLAVINTVLMIPAVFGVYYNVKHIFMPIDALGLLDATKKCDMSALSFHLYNIIYIFAFTLGSNVLYNLSMILISLSLFALSIFAVKGAKEWSI